MSIPLAISIGAALVGCLYALHHLRVQPRRTPTATLLFWRAAARPRRARVPWSRRFSHPWTFLLLAAILLLLTAALTADRWGRHDRRTVVVVDAGADTATDVGGRPLLRVLADAAAAGLRGPAALIAAGPQPLLLAGPDEPAAVVARRLRQASPQPGGSAASLALLMAGGVLGDRPGRIDWYTAQSELPPGLPADFARAVVLHHVRSPGTMAIVGVTFAAPTGDRGTLHVRLAGGGPATLAVDGVPRPVRAAGDVAVDGVVADGRVVTLGLAGRATVRYTLPDRRRLTFRFAGDVPRPLRLALLTAGGESAAGGIFVAPQGTAVPADAAAVVAIVAGGTGTPAGQPLALAESPLTRGLDLEAAVAAAGPAVPGTPLVTAGPTVLAGLDQAARPTLYLSTAIVGPAADLPRHAAFPVLLGRLCDAVVTRAEPPVVVAAGRAAVDPLWTGPADVPAMLVSAAADRPPAASTPSSPAADSPALRWAEVVLVLALTLLVVESLLRAARKIV